MEKNTESKDIQNRIKHILSVLTGMGVLVFFYIAVKCNAFGGTLWDRGVYLLGGLITGFFVFKLIQYGDFYHIGESFKNKENRRSGLRITAFSIIFLMTLYYYDSASDYGHTVGLRIIVLLLGMIIISYLNETREKDPVESLLHQGFKDGVSLWLVFTFGILWMLFGILAPYIVAKFGALNYDAVLFLSGNEEITGVMAAFWDIMAFFPAPLDGKSIVPYVLWGLMVLCILEAILRLVSILKAKKPLEEASLYGKLVYVFLAALLIFSNGRLWVISVVIPFGILYLCPVKKDILLKELAKGVMLSFWIMAFGALLFRPYYSFEFIRYPGWFASVASASMYRMLTAVSSLCALMAVYHKKDKGAEKLYCMMTLGASLSTLIMGMARTSLLGTGVVFLAVFVLSILVHYKGQYRIMFMRAGLVICVFLAAFPAVYTAIRIVPAIISRPVWITGAEWFSDRIQNGEDPASTKYMNVPQLGESLLEKLLGKEINLSSMAGAHSGPGDGIQYDSDGNVISVDENVVEVYKGEDGQLYTVKDYSFKNDSDQSGANGRFEILEIYAKELNLTGHSSMIPQNVPENLIIYHAHNTYMQTAYDHGVITGLLFALVCICGIIKAVFYYKKHHDDMDYAIYPMAVMICFVMAGMTEWIFHPSIPVGFAFLTVIAPLTDREV